MAIEQENKPQSVLKREAIITIGLIFLLGYVIFRIGASGAKAEIRIGK